MIVYLKQEYMIYCLNYTYLHKVSIQTRQQTKGKGHIQGIQQESWYEIKWSK
jgi:hypothetical protein